MQKKTILAVLNLQESLWFLSTDVMLDNKVGSLHYPILRDQNCVYVYTLRV